MKISDTLELRKARYYDHKQKAIKQENDRKFQAAINEWRQALLFAPTLDLRKFALDKLRNCIQLTKYEESSL